MEFLTNSKVRKRFGENDTPHSPSAFRLLWGLATPENRKGGPGCCHYPIRHCPIAGRPTRLPPGGDVCSLARRISLCRQTKAVACMSLSFSPCSGSVAAPAFCDRLSSFDGLGMPRDFMGSNGKVWDKMGTSCAGTGGWTGFCGKTGSSQATVRDHARVIPQM